MTYLLRYYVSACTDTKLDHTSRFRYNFTRCGCSFASCQGHCMKVYTAHCHDKEKVNIVQFFPVYWFWAIDNRHVHRQETIDTTMFSHTGRDEDKMNITFGWRHWLTARIMSFLSRSIVVIPSRGTRSFPTTVEQTNSRMYWDNGRLKKHQVLVVNNTYKTLFNSSPSK